MRLALAIAALAVAPAPALAAGELVSRESGRNGAPAADGDSNAVAVADGGRFVLFNSRADNLSRVDYDTTDNDRQSTAYVRDMRTGRMTLVGYNRRNRVVDDVVSATDMTPDARFVVFSSPAANLGGPGVFVRDMKRRRTRRVGLGYGAGLISDDGRVIAQQVDGILSVVRGRRTKRLFTPRIGRAVRSFAISGDGRTVSYAVGPTERPPAGTTVTVDILVANARTGRSRLVRRDSYGENLQSFALPLSFDGRHLATLRPVAKPGLTRAFSFDVLRDDRVVNRDGCRERREVLASSGVAMSGDGRRVAWIGPSPKGDSPEFPWVVFVADVPRCRVLELEAEGGALPEDDSFGAVLSADGRWVAFSSWADNLSDEDDDDVVNAYVTRVPR